MTRSGRARRPGIPGTTTVAIKKILAYSTVVDQLLDFPKEYIKFSSYEKEKVVSLLDVIKSERVEIEGETYCIDEDLNAIIAKKALSKRAHYSELVTLWLPQGLLPQSAD